MKKKYLNVTYILLFSVAVISAILFTKDIIQAQAAGKVYLNETSLTLELGHYRTLKIKGTSDRVYWSSANNRAATVTSSGKVTARGWGSTYIYAHVGNKRLKCKVTIVQMNKKNVTLAAGETENLTLWGAREEVTWKSSNTSVAVVSDSGKVTAKAPGSATITATTDGKKITSKVTVVGLNHTSVVLEYDGIFSATKAGFGNVKTLKVTDTDNKITWSSSDKSVATVSGKGKVTAKGPGTAIITASVGGAKMTCEVQVLQMSLTEVTLKEGETTDLEIFGTDSVIDWNSYNTSVAVVSKKGTVTAKAPGTTKIVGIVDGRIVRSIVTVED